MYSLPEPVRHAIESGRAPSPPQILLRLLQMVDDDSTTMAKLAGLVEQDPGLCTRVLTAANSPAIRRGTQLQSIENCLIALGTRLVRSIATCLSVQNLFDERAARDEGQCEVQQDGERRCAVLEGCRGDLARRAFHGAHHDLLRTFYWGARIGQR